MAKAKIFKHKEFGNLHVIVEEDGKVLFMQLDIVRILDVPLATLLVASCFIAGEISDYELVAKDGKKARFLFMDERLVQELTDCPLWRDSEQRKWLLETVLAEAKKDTSN